ncbi:family 78 glycoside hydrolase catalytic domain [Nonomuraea polychroma]|uniref:family 78 glycoside hydrolase catalytic domain n=1 Tax=Nonomuraea polychroma TaxID=46176 RepID=UPI003D8CA8BF
MTSPDVPTLLRAEYAADPLGIDEPRPRFSWRPAYQSAYHVQVTAGEALVWDSGKVRSAQASHVAYAGAPLRATTRYRWQVRTWDLAGEASAWSAPGWFETGPLEPGDWLGARWITRQAEDRLPAPLLRKTFVLPDRPVERARLYLSALGYGEAYLDGVKIGTNLLDPAPTDYAKTVLYTTHEVTVGGGEHVLAVELGRGRYGEPASSVWFWDRAPWWDHPKVLARLSVWFAGGGVAHVVTDTSWRTTAGPVRFDSLYLGEHHDARLARPGWTLPGNDDADWPHAVEAPPPTGVLRAQQQEPIRPVAELAPVAVTEPVPGVHVVDFGRQLAGHARLTLTGSAGSAVTVRYGERLGENGTVELRQRHIDGDIQTDTFILAGRGEETFEPRFGYKGFQYVQVEGLPHAALRAATAVEVRTDVASTGEFACDGDLVTRIHQATRRAVLNNLHGLPTDTPTYEKNGWTADAHLTADTAAYNFAMPRLYTKWLRDFADAQLPSGELPPIVPTSGWGYRGSEASITAPVPAWDAAYLEIPWVMYRHYGDERILARHYDGQRRYLDFLLETAVEDGVVRGGLGDFLAPGAPGIPPEGPAVHETAYTYRIVTLLKSIAGVLGRAGDLSGYDEVAAQIRRGFNAAFLDPAAAAYHGEHPTEYRQTPNVLALAFGLVPGHLRQRVFDGLAADIKARDNHLNTGVLGTKHLFPLLTSYGLTDLALEVATQRTYPGYGHWLDLGATALFEAWHAEARSRNHHFYGSIDQWFYEHIAGISPGAPGYAQVRVRPSPPAALRWAGAAEETIRGRVACHWRRTGHGLELTVEIPPGATGEVHVPAAVSRHAPGARHLRHEDGYEVFSCHDGMWTFHTD